MRTLRTVSFLLALCVPWALAAQVVELVMVEERGCIWCARWNTDVGTEYPKSAEGQAAPLRRVDLHAPPRDLTFASAPRVTPTFVLIIDGTEAGRIEGYPGEHFFWPMLGAMLDKNTNWRDKP